MPQQTCSKKKIDEIFKELPNFFGTADDILVVDITQIEQINDEILKGVMKICRKENLRLNMHKYHLNYMAIPFFGEKVSRSGVQPD